MLPTTAVTRLVVSVATGLSINAKCGPATLGVHWSGVRSAYRRIDLALHNGKRVGLNARDLRSYAATSYDKSGGSLKELSKALAHTNRTTTAGYIHQHTVPVVEIDLQTPARSDKS